MDILLQWMNAILSGIPFLLTNPFFYLMIVVICLQWKRQVDIERKLFSVRIHTMGEGVIYTLFYGVIVGVAISLLIVGVGIVLPLEALLFLWIISFILFIFHIRYLCFAYSGAFLALLVAVTHLYPNGANISFLQGTWTSLQSIYLPSLFAFIAILHLAEAVLVYWTGTKRGIPIVLNSKRGRLVGGFQFQHFWFLPIAFISFGQGAAVPQLFQGWPVFQGDIGGAWTLLILPAVLGFSEVSSTSRAKEKGKESFRLLIIYSFVLLLFATLSIFVPLLIWFALLFSFFGHEGLRWYSKWKEQQGIPIYVHPPKGLTILEVVPFSPAQKMGLVSGEVILSVNGKEVSHSKGVYEALTINLTFVKLQVQNLNGHVKFVQSTLYEQDHHQLGVILAPNEDFPYYVDYDSFDLWSLISQRLEKKRREVYYNRYQQEKNNANEANARAKKASKNRVNNVVDNLDKAKPNSEQHQNQGTISG